MWLWSVNSSRKDNSMKCTTALRLSQQLQTMWVVETSSTTELYGQKYLQFMEMAGIHNIHANRMSQITTRIWRKHWRVQELSVVLSSLVFIHTINIWNNENTVLLSNLMYPDLIVCLLTDHHRQMSKTKLIFHIGCRLKSFVIIQYKCHFCKVPIHSKRDILWVNDFRGGRMMYCVSYTISVTCNGTPLRAPRAKKQHFLTGKHQIV